MNFKASAVTACNVCGSSALTWQTCNTTRSGIQQGRLNTSDVDCQFFLGCDECSETLATVSADKVASLMTLALAGGAPQEQPSQIAAKLDRAVAVLRKVDMTPHDRWYADGLNFEVAQILRDNEPPAS